MFRSLTIGLGAVSLVAVAMVSVSFPASGQQPARTKSSADKTALDLTAVAEAKRALDNKLLDYRAARFRAVRLVRTDKGFNAFCGQVNTTNRMGGYSGWRAFVLPLGDSSVAGVYDRPTIEGQPTTVGSFFSQYGDKKLEGDPAARLVAGARGETAERLDQADYTDALTYQP